MTPIERRDVRLHGPGSFQAVFGMVDDQDELRSTVRHFLERRSPMSVTRARMDETAPVSNELWAGLCDLGVPGMIIPAEHGGAGLTLTDAVVALEETGRALLCAPHLSTLAAVAALLQSGDDEACARHLPRIANGTCTATLAIAEQSDWSAHATALRADASGRLHGSKELVLDGATADLYVVSARDDDDSIALYTVEADAGGVTARPLPTLDQTRRLADVRFDGAPGRRLGQAASMDHDVGQAVDVALVLLAAEQIGAAQRVLELAVEHATSRMQYDRYIGSFQAVKHMCADMLVEIEYARGTVYYAAWAASSGSDELAALTGVLKSAVAEAFVFAAGRCIQIHGGMGFTWEHDAHLFYKRAVGDRLLFGTTEQHLDRMAETLGVRQS